MEAVAKKLIGIESCPSDEQFKMVNRACKAAENKHRELTRDQAERVESLKAEVTRLNSLLIACTKGCVKQKRDKLDRSLTSNTY